LRAPLWRVSSKTSHEFHFYVAVFWPKSHAFLHFTKIGGLPPFEHSLNIILPKMGQNSPPK
jgi:hypothetical protein